MSEMGRLFPPSCGLSFSNDVEHCPTQSVMETPSPCRQLCSEGEPYTFAGIPLMLPSLEIVHDHANAVQNRLEMVVKSEPCNVPVEMAISPAKSQLSDLDDELPQCSHAFKLEEDDVFIARPAAPTMMPLKTAYLNAHEMDAIFTKLQHVLIIEDLKSSDRIVTDSRQMWQIRNIPDVRVRRLTDPIKLKNASHRQRMSQRASGPTTSTDRLLQIRKRMRDALESCFPCVRRSREEAERTARRECREGVVDLLASRDDLVDEEILNEALNAAAYLPAYGDLITDQIVQVHVSDPKTSLYIEKPDWVKQLDRRKLLKFAHHKDQTSTADDPSAVAATTSSSTTSSEPFNKTNRSIKLRRKKRQPLLRTCLPQAPAAEQSDIFDNGENCIRNLGTSETDFFNFNYLTCKRCGYRVNSREVSHVLTRSCRSGIDVAVTETTSSLSNSYTCDKCRKSQMTKQGVVKCPIKDCTAMPRRFRDSKHLPSAFFRLDQHLQLRLLSVFDLSQTSFRCCSACFKMLTVKLEAFLRFHADQLDQTEMQMAQDERWTLDESRRLSRSLLTMAVNGWDEASQLFTAKTAAQCRRHALYTKSIILDSILAQSNVQKQHPSTPSWSRLPDEAVGSAATSRHTEPGVGSSEAIDNDPFAGNMKLFWTREMLKSKLSADPTKQTDSVGGGGGGSGRYVMVAADSQAPSVDCVLADISPSQQPLPGNNINNNNNNSAAMQAMYLFNTTGLPWATTGSWWNFADQQQPMTTNNSSSQLPSVNVMGSTACAANTYVQYVCVDHNQTIDDCLPAKKSRLTVQSATDDSLPKMVNGHNGMLPPPPPSSFSDSSQLLSTSLTVNSSGDCGNLTVASCEDFLLSNSSVTSIVTSQSICKYQNNAPELLNLKSTAPNNVFHVHNSSH